MNIHSTAQAFKNHLTKNNILNPHLHIVLGSGLGSALDQIKLNTEWQDQSPLSFKNLPGIDGATVPGHAGVYRFYIHRPSNKTLIFQQGRLHGYEGLDPKTVIQTVAASALSGTPNFILTNAAGSLTLDFDVGSVMLFRDHVNLTGQNPLTGHNLKLESGLEMGPRFPDMTEVYPEAFRKSISETLKQNGVKVNEGIYLGLSGPSFETPAEVSLFSRWGLHAVGMSTVWEAIFLKYLGKNIAGLSLISNVGCGLNGNQPLDHLKVLKESEAAAHTILTALFHYAGKLFTNQENP